MEGFSFMQITLVLQGLFYVSQRFFYLTKGHEFWADIHTENLADIIRNLAGIIKHIVTLADVAAGYRTKSFNDPLNIPIFDSSLLYYSY